MSPTYCLMDFILNNPKAAGEMVGNKTATTAMLNEIVLALERGLAPYDLAATIAENIHAAPPAILTAMRNSAVGHKALQEEQASREAIAGGTSCRVTDWTEPSLLKTVAQLAEYVKVLATNNVKLKQQVAEYKKKLDMKDIAQVFE